MPGHLGARDHRAVAAQPLGRVQGLVAGLEQRVAGLAVDGEAHDAEADRQRRRRPARSNARSIAVRSALGQDVGAVLVGVRGEDRELLAPDPGGGVPAALAWTRAPAHPAQRLVAGAVAEAVVDALEAVEVADDHAQALLGAPRALELDVEDLLEAAPVEQAGERVARAASVRSGDPAAEAVARRRPRAGPAPTSVPDRRRPSRHRRRSRGRAATSTAANSAPISATCTSAVADREEPERRRAPATGRAAGR